MEITESVKGAEEKEGVYRLRKKEQKLLCYGQRKKIYKFCESKKQNNSKERV